MITVACQPGTGNIIFVFGEVTFLATPEEAENFAHTLKNHARRKKKIKVSIEDLGGVTRSFEGSTDQAMAMYRLVSKTLELVPQAMAMGLQSTAKQDE